MDNMLFANFKEYILALILFENVVIFYVYIV